jgi:hypothetical protein
VDALPPNVSVEMMGENVEEGEAAELRMWMGSASEVWLEIVKCAE